MTGSLEAVRDIEAVVSGSSATVGQATVLDPVDRVDPLTGATILISVQRVSLFWLGQRSVNACGTVDRPLTGPLTGTPAGNGRSFNNLIVIDPLRNGSVNAVNAI